jgi:hypothetical protein
VAIAALRLGARSGGDACVRILTDWQPDLAKRPRVFDRERAGAALNAVAQRQQSGDLPADPSPYRHPKDLQSEGEKWRSWWKEAQRKLVPAPDTTTDPALLRALLKPHIATFSGEHFFSRKLAQEILADTGREGRSWLYHLLRDERIPFRQYAAEGLGLTHAPDALPFLVHAFHDELSALVRREIVRSVRRLVEKARPLTQGEAALATAVISQAQKDPDPGVRDAATRD